MSKPIKILLVIVALVLLLPVIAAIIATQVIDTDDIKKLAADQVAAQTGRQLTIDGEIGMSIFPWLSLDLGHTSLSNAPGFGTEPMIEVEQISVSLKLLPLLSGNIQLDTIELDGLKADLQIDADGQSNFADLAGEPSVAAQQPATTPVQKSSSGGMALAIFTLGGIEITNARIHWRDQTTGTDIDVHDLNLESGVIFPGQPVDIVLDAVVELIDPALITQLSGSAELLISNDFNQITLTPFIVEIAATGESLPNGKLNTSLSTAIAVDLAADTLAIDGLALAALGLELKAGLAVTQLSEAPQVTAELNIAPFNAQKLLKALAMPAIETADEDVLKNISAGLKITADENQATLSNLTIQLDQTQINGEARVVNFDNPAINFQLALDSIDLDRYLPPPPPDPVKPTPTTPAVPQTASAEEPLNLGESLAGLAALTLDGSLTIGKLKISNIRSNDISLKVKANKGRLVLDPISANLYEGKFNGAVKINGSTQPPTVSVTQTLTGVSLAPLSEDAADIDLISGTATIKATLSTQGNQEDELIRNLNGKMGFDIEDGTLKDINIDRSVCLARKGIKVISGKEPSNEPCPPDGPTKFSAFKATATITDGILKSNDLFIEQLRVDPTKFLHIKGAGKVDLNQQTLDYRVIAARVKKQADGSYKTRGNAIPVKISGTLSAPSVTPDLDDVVKEQAQRKLLEELAPKLAPKDDDSPEEQLKKKFLRGLFN
ncbi:MAG: hypothetical protein DRQ54_02840 [Gammaproteobacteria bacterium]|nr:MAG: hypothetical protein DRQ54_02840 [Gammaproteobacteria bacterium]RLA14841.1 MAG: hypothetical protein DRQ52_03250 [Gammaproteobacteria bacterium]